MNYENIDETVRNFMQEEYDFDKNRNRIYFSPRLTEEGTDRYTQFLQNALTYGTEKWLAEKLREADVIKDREMRMNPLGGISEVKVPPSTPDIIAEGEFSRYYLRAICRKAINEGIKKLEIISDRPPDTISDKDRVKVGRFVNPKDLLEDLRQNSYVNSRFGIPSPKSGLSVRFSR